MSANVTVIGIGAMGGGMARSLLNSNETKTLLGYDRNATLCHSFFEESLNARKAASDTPPSALDQAISQETTACVLVLVNEAQCESVCFGTDEPNLSTLMPPNSCVILCSTVTATWARKAAATFAKLGVHFVDCPISGGPVRAASGDLTMMASGDDKSLQVAMPLLRAMGSGGDGVHVIPGGAGFGSTTKMVHQLLAGVHVVVAAEALALAAKAGLNVEQLYDIVNGAAGHSWMFQDRGKRMIHTPEEVKSALDIFVKDLDIVYAEAKALQSPIPIASAALQQFISAQGKGLGQKDDSQVVAVYESVTGVPVAKSSSTSIKKEGDDVGDLWTFENGTTEEILEVGDEPSHNLVVSNEYTRILRVEFPPFGASLAHRHAEDSLYFFLVEGGLDVINHVKGFDPECDCMDFGEVRYGTHKTEKPLTHKITNRSNKRMLCIDAEVLKQPPVISPLPLVAEKHELIKTRDKCRVYRLLLEPGESVTNVTYPFFFVLITLQSSTVKTHLSGGGGSGVSWEETPQLGDVQWKEPATGLGLTNVGTTPYEAYIAEWR